MKKPVNLDSAEVTHSVLTGQERYQRNGGQAIHQDLEDFTSNTRAGTKYPVLYVLFIYVSCVMFILYFLSISSPQRIWGRR